MSRQRKEDAAEHEFECNSPFSQHPSNNPQHSYTTYSPADGLAVANSRLAASLFTRLRCTVRLGFVTMFNSYDDISSFVSLVHIPVCIDKLLQRIGSVDNRLKMSRFNQLF